MTHRRIFLGQFFFIIWLNMYCNFVKFLLKWVNSVFGCQNFQICYKMTSCHQAVTKYAHSYFHRSIFYYLIEYVLQLLDRISTEKSRAVDRYTFQFWTLLAISIKFPFHKQSEKIIKCATNRDSLLLATLR